MATHSNILARRIPWTEEPGRQVNGPQADGCEPEAQASQIIHLVSGLETPVAK